MRKLFFLLLLSAPLAYAGDITFNSTTAGGGDVTDVNEGFAIDVTDPTGPAPTVAFDQTEFTGSRTWGDASTDTIVWTWNRATGTDPTITFGDGTITGQIVAASTGFEVNGERVTDWTGSNMSIVNGALTSTASGSGNSFETISVPAGTNPVADSSTDTLTITETSTPLVITGTAGTDTIDITWTTLGVDQGGTGATSLTDGGILLGSGTGAITALGVAANGQIPIGDGTTDPVLATMTEGLAIDITNGAGSITTAFDPTELTGSRTWGDASTDTIVWTWDRATGTDPTLTMGSNTVTGPIVAASVGFEVNGERVTDFTGTNITIVNGALTAASASASAGGSDTQIQYNNATALGGMNNATWDDATDTLTLGATVELDAGGATSVEIPNATSPTVDTLGEIAFDTTSGQLVVFDGTNVDVVPVELNKCATIENLVAADDNVPIYTFEDASTMRRTNCYTTGMTTQPTYLLEDASGNAVTGASLCTTHAEKEWTNTTAANTFTRGETLRIDTTNTPAPTTGTFTTICWVYTVDRQ